jgi:hypothetical protein
MWSTRRPRHGTLVMSLRGVSGETQRQLSISPVEDRPGPFKKAGEPRERRVALVKPHQGRPPIRSIRTQEFQIDFGIAGDRDTSTGKVERLVTSPLEGNAEFPGDRFGE